MPAIVEYSSDTYAELFEPILKAYPDLLTGILSDFQLYIDSDRRQTPAYFGCEAPYIRPQEAYNEGLMHIHLAIPPVTFPQNRPRADRKCPQGDPEKDAALVYARGLYEDHRYVLIAILHPGAHDKARTDKIMKRLARAANKFREKY